MTEIIIVLLLVAVALLAWIAWRLLSLQTMREEILLSLKEGLEEKHRAMLGDMHGGLAQQADRVGAHLADSGERLRAAVAEELRSSRDTLHALRLSLSQDLNQSRDAMSQSLAGTTQALTARIGEHLEQISGKVNERLEEGFRKTNETFVNVMQRLATIDEAQKKIESLTGSVVSLQELLGDKKSRGAFGEVQLEALVRNIMPAQAFAMQYTLSNGNRVDCVLKLPEPTGMVPVDSKFPLENYHRMFADGAGEAERSAAQKQFRADLKKHVDDIAGKYIIAGETSDGAVMFVPAEAVFAEIHAFHAEVVDYAMARRVWIVSPTTLMAVLNTARAVLKDFETRRQIHLIKEALSRLAVEFERFEARMRDLAKHIRLAHEDVEKIQVTGGKIAQQFQRIEAAEVEDQPDNVVRLGEERRQ
ncbi:MAG: DNA recombination protein RmuC [Rhodocyclaceae bacterium]|nr:DNA recombination protein RmuC [Rhodocyclaceae bacterium]